MTEDSLPPLLAETPIAYYRLDAHDNLVAANPAWLELHGYTSLDEVLGRNIDFVFVNPQDPEELRKTIIDTGIIKDKTLELKRAKDERFWGAIYSRRLTDENSIYIGREGFIVDATERVIHQRIMKHIPIGYYAVDTKSGTDKITYWNKEFAEMFDFPPNSSFLDIDISDLYLNRDDYEKFRKRMLTKGEEIIQHELEVHTIDKTRIFSMEAIARIQRTETGEVTGRVGVVRDLTKDEPLNLLRENLGTILHSFTTGFLVMKGDLDTTIRALGPNSSPQASPQAHLHLLNQMRKPVFNLRMSLSETLKILRQRGNKTTLSVKLEELETDLEYVEEIEDIFRIHSFRDIAEKIADACQGPLYRPDISYQAIEQLKLDAYEVLQVFARYRLIERVSDVLDMQHTLNTLRAYLTAPSQVVPLPRSIVDFWELVRLASHNLYDFAASKGVTFRRSLKVKTTTIIANEQEILRAVSNLLHNAIKYSWSRDSGTWIEVKLVEGNNTLRLEIENYGVPIPKDEIESGLIYKFGFRSRLSSDRGRIGSGIGLADAYSIIKRYDGSVSIRSRPASRGGSAENLDPFLTTAVLTIPISGETDESQKTDSLD